MRWLVVLAVVGCGSSSADPPPRVANAWRWGATPTDEGGPRMHQPTDPAPVGAVALVAGRGKVVVATRDGCLELLDGKTGTSLKHACTANDWVTGLDAAGDVAIVARGKSIRGLALADLGERWHRDGGAVQTNQPLARPGLVDGRACFLETGARSLAITCLDAATGRATASWEVPPASAVAFGTKRIVVVARDPAAKEQPIRIYGVDGKLVREDKLANAQLEQSRPIFFLRGGGVGGWTNLFLDADGTALVTQTGKTFVRGGARAGDLVLTTSYGSPGGKRSDDLIALGKPDRIAWQADLGVTGPWPPAIAIVDRVAIVAHGGVFAIDLDGHTVAKQFPFEARSVAVWRDKLAFVVETRATRSDSNRGDAGVYAIDVRSKDVVMRDDVGRDVPGGQLASEPVFDGDFAYAIAGGRVHAYRIAP